MKKLMFFGLACILLLPLLIIGCKTEATTIEITLDEFTTAKQAVKNIELTHPGSLTVRLGSNATTGYAWGEAEISVPAAIAQASREFVSPENKGMVGAAGTDVWVFDSKAPGTATIKMSYGQPWDGGEKDAFTLTINVTVK